MTTTAARTTVCVQCEIELLKRGFERAITRAGLVTTDQESQAALLVRDGTNRANERSPLPLLIVDDDRIAITVTRPIDPPLWDAVRELANAILQAH